MRKMWKRKCLVICSEIPFAWLWNNFWRPGISKWMDLREWRIFVCFDLTFNFGEKLKLLTGRMLWIIFWIVLVVQLKLNASRSIVCSSNFASNFSFNRQPFHIFEQECTIWGDFFVVNGAHKAVVIQNFRTANKMQNDSSICVVE